MVKPRGARTVAILTALGWNILPLIALAFWVVWTLSHPDTGEDWSGVVAVILIVFGGGAIAVAAGAGTVFATMLTRKRLEGGFKWGSLAALLGWLVPVALLGILGIARALGAPI